MNRKRNRFRRAAFFCSSSLPPSPLVFVIPLSDFIGDLYKNTIFVGLALIITGFIIFLSDRMPRGEKTVLQSTWKDALVIGFMQIFATLPGISRSGLTISAGLFRGFDRKYAVKFSFLMSLPAILGANIFSLADTAKAGIDASMIPIYLAGMLAAAVSGYFAIQLMRYIANKNKFGKFAVYCVIVGALVIVLSLFGL